MSDDTSEVVLVTGANGYIGTQVCLEFLKAGYRVRGSFRTQTKADQWTAQHAPQPADSRFESTIIANMDHTHSFEEAVKDVSIVVHTASPAAVTATEDPKKDVLLPAYHGVMNILHAAHHTSTVRRVVYTSSITTAIDMDNDGPEMHLDESSWNPATWESAIERNDPIYTYRASKTVAEQALWAYMDTWKPAFDVTTLCVGRTYGPPQQVIQSIVALNVSVAALWAIIDAKQLPPTGTPYYNDVRDVAKIHLMAATSEAARNQRYILSTSVYNNDASAQIIKEHFPEQAHRVPDFDPQRTDLSVKRHFQVNASKHLRDFRFERIPYKTSVIETMTRLFELEQQLQQV